MLAEFVIAIVPIFAMFFSFIQLSRLATARLVVKHAAIVGARSAAVMSNANDNTPDQSAGGANQGAIQGAVQTAIGPWAKTMVVSVTVKDSSSRADPYGWVEVKVSATYACRVPLGFLACGGMTKQIVETYQMPHQGANYRMGAGSQS